MKSPGKTCILRYGYMAGIVLITIFAYWNVQYNQLINYDDVKYLIENEPVRNGLNLSSIKWAFTTTYDANWFPLTWLSHMLDMTLFGPNPLGHHLVSLLLHCTNALLILTVLHKLTSRLSCSTAVALLFAVHPLHVESVVWAAERKDVLSTLFFMLTLRAYIRYTADKSHSAYISTVLCYLCGLASKPMLVTLPFILLLLDFWPLARLAPLNSSHENKGRCLWLLVREKIPLLLLSAASCIITFTVQRNGGTVNAGTDFSLMENTLHAFHNYAGYLYKTILPVRLCPIYPYIGKLPLIELIISIILIMMCCLLAYCLRASKPYIAVGWWWFAITLLPVIGLIKIGAHSIADRYTYIPSIGIFIIVVWSVGDLLRGRRHEKFIAGILVIVTGMTLAGITRKQTTYWESTITLFNRAIAVTRDNWVAHSLLGSELVKYNQPKEALLHLKEAVRLNPENSDSYYNMGLVQNMLGDLPGAITSLQRAIELRSDYDKAYFMIGRLYFITGDRQAARSTLTALQHINTEMADALESNYVLLEQTIIK